MEYKDNQSITTAVELQAYNLSKINWAILWLMNHVGLKKYTAGFVKKTGSFAWTTGVLKNKGTNTGVAAIAGLFSGVGSISTFTYLAVGTSSTAVSAAHTALQAEITDSGLARVSATMTRSTTNVTNDTAQFDYTWTVSGTKTVEEIGVLNASSSGILGGRCLTTSKALISGQALIATYKVTFVVA